MRILGGEDLRIIDPSLTEVSPDKKAPALLNLLNPNECTTRSIWDDESATFFSALVVHEELYRQVTVHDSGHHEQNDFAMMIITIN